MAPIPGSIVDSVKSLGLNGSTDETNGTLPDVVVKNICCVGAGYVGEWPMTPNLQIEFVVPCRAADDRSMLGPLY